MNQAVHDSFDQRTETGKLPASRASSALVLLGILLVSAVLRFVFFSGFQGRDDRNYVAYAISVSEHHHFPAEIQTQWVGRIGHWLPIAGVFALGGVSEFTLGYYSLICSLAGIAITYGIGCQLFNPRIAAIGALLLAVLPLDVIYSTTAYADVPVATFMLIALGGMLQGRKAVRPFGWFLLAGLATGLSWLCRPTAVAMLPCLAAMGWSAHNRKAALAMPMGLLLVLAAEAAFWQTTTGDPLFGIHAAQAKHHQNQQSELANDDIETADAGGGAFTWIPAPRPRDRYRSENSLLDLLLMFVANQEFGVYYLVAAPLLVVAMRRDPPSRWLLVWIAMNTLILAFFPFVFPRHTLPRDPRYYSCISGPVCVCMAAALGHLRPATRWLTCGMLVASSLVCLGIDTSRMAMDGARQLAVEIESHAAQPMWLPPQERFAVSLLSHGKCDDRLGVHTLTSHSDSDSFISLRLVCPAIPVATSLDEMHNGSLVLPERRVVKGLEDSGWQLEKTVIVPRSALRTRGFEWGKSLGLEDKYLLRLFPGGGKGYDIWQEVSDARL